MYAEWIGMLNLTLPYNRSTNIVFPAWLEALSFVYSSNTNWSMSEIDDPVLARMRVLLVLLVAGYVLGLFVVVHADTRQLRQMQPHLV